MASAKKGVGLGRDGWYGWYNGRYDEVCDGLRGGIETMEEAKGVTHDNGLSVRLNS